MHARVFESAATRVAISVCIGIVAAVLVSGSESWAYAPLVCWDVAAGVFSFWVWAVARHHSPEQTKELGVREDPGRGMADVLLILASVASLAGVGVLLLQAGESDRTGQLLRDAFGVISIAISWITIHTIYALRYARVFYTRKGGIDFHDESEPCYLDFAYMAFTVGMTFQVSDTDFKNTAFRRMALRHALVSYVFGAVILAVTINLIAGLVK